MHTDYLTTSEVAKICHVTRFTVLNWVKKHKLESTATLGGHQRIPRKAVLNLLKKNETTDQPAVDTVSDAAPHAVQKAVQGANSPAAVGAFLARQKSNLGNIVKKGAFSSGKYIAAFKHQMVNTVSTKS